MSKEKFTQGEWEAVIYAGGHRLDVWSGDDRIYQNESITDSLEEVANAHLIAAAPDMYRMLNDIAINLKSDGNGCFDNTVGVIGKLLAKARGE